MVRPRGKKSERKRLMHNRGSDDSTTTLRDKEQSGIKKNKSLSACCKDVYSNLY